MPIRNARSGPFVAVNCGAMPAELIEAELFGAEAGAYTGANRARVGRFEAADGGTLFLDEIGNLPLAGQVKLLRVLETGQFEPLGSSRTRQTRVRVVSATNADLPPLIREGTFPRGSVLPPEHHRDRAAAAGRTARRYPAAGRAFPRHRAAHSAMRRVGARCRHAWPGNVRELRNSIERARLLARDSVVQRSDLNLPAAAHRAGAPGRCPDG